MSFDAMSNLNIKFANMKEISVVVNGDVEWRIPRSMFPKVEPNGKLTDVCNAFVRVFHIPPPTWMRHFMRLPKWLCGSETDLDLLCYTDEELRKRQNILLEIVALTTTMELLTLAYHRLESIVKTASRSTETPACNGQCLCVHECFLAHAGVAIYQSGSTSEEKAAIREDCAFIDRVEAFIQPLYSANLDQLHRVMPCGRTQPIPWRFFSDSFRPHGLKPKECLLRIQ